MEVNVEGAEAVLVCVFVYVVVDGMNKRKSNLDLLGFTSNSILAKQH